MKAIGIDPGASGAIAIIDPGCDQLATFKLDATERDIADWIHAMTSGQQRHAFIESVHSMPKQGVSSSFKFGRSYGFLRGLLIGLQIPFEEVTPQRWQKEMSCLTGGDKNVSKSRAQQLWPELKWTHAISDAALIAEYGRRVLNQRNGIPATPQEQGS